MLKILFFAVLIGFAPLPAHAERDGWDDDGFASTYDDSGHHNGIYDDDDNSDLYTDTREDNDTRRQDDSHIGNGFGRTGSRTLGETVLDQLSPASGR